jgi:hypothetical protein
MPVDKIRRIEPSNFPTGLGPIHSTARKLLSGSDHWRGRMGGCAEGCPILGRGPCQLEEAAFVSAQNALDVARSKAARALRPGFPWTYDLSPSEGRALGWS